MIISSQISESGFNMIQHNEPCFVCIHHNGSVKYRPLHEEEVSNSNTVTETKYEIFAADTIDNLVAEINRLGLTEPTYITYPNLQEGEGLIFMSKEDLISSLNSYCSTNGITASTIFLEETTSVNTIKLWGYNFKLNPNYSNGVDIEENTIKIKADKVTVNIKTTGSVEILNDARIIGSVTDLNGTTIYNE